MVIRLVIGGYLVVLVVGTIFFGYMSVRAKRRLGVQPAHRWRDVWTLVRTDWTFSFFIVGIFAGSAIPLLFLIAVVTDSGAVVRVMKYADAIASWAFTLLMVAPIVTLVASAVRQKLRLRRRSTA
jgi:MFS family permease